MDQITIVKNNKPPLPKCYGPCEHSELRMNGISCTGELNV